jgi:acyl transferase domain-containing protein
MGNFSERFEKMTPLQRAVYALKETQTRLNSLERKLVEPIAVIGLACRFPGGANDPEAYWRLLVDEVDAIGQVPPDRWDVDAFYDPDPTVPGKMHTRWGGFLERIDEFDNHFFGISEREAALIDPQQRLLLELSWEALEDAGLPPADLKRARVGVFVALGSGDYGTLLVRDASQSDAYATAGLTPCITANRISFAFDFTGPSLVMDSACSASLVAMHVACQALRSGDCEAALVGAVNLMVSPMPMINLAKSGLLTSDRKVRAFDAAASGYVRGEGAGVIVLKRLSDAAKDGDSIRALIRGSAVTQNGRGNGLTAPSRLAQEETLRQAYSRAGISPGQVAYVETQGSGTRMGDAIEAMALGSVLNDNRAPGYPCAIGSVKTNVGHLESASGIASLIKVVLSLEHGLLPATLHFHTPNPDIPFHELPLSVQRTTGPWPGDASPRMAGVSGFGLGGTNAHVVLEEAPAPTPPSTAGESEGDGIGLLLLSARTEDALRDLARKYVAFLGDSASQWSDVCYTAAVRREHHDCRLAVLAASHQEAIDHLTAFLAGEQRASVFAGRKPVGREPRIAFAYAGNPESWGPYAPLVARLAASLPETVNEMEELFGRETKRPLSTVFSDSRGECDGILPAMLARQWILTCWFGRGGLTPAVVLGHGHGELMGACAAGLLTASEAFREAANANGDSFQPLGYLASRTALLPYVSTGAAAPSDDDLSTAIEALRKRQVDFCLEIGPPCLAPKMVAAASENGALWAARPALTPPGDTHEGLRPVLGAMYAAGANLAWKRIVPRGLPCAGLPRYPWQRQRLWAIHRNPFLATASGDAVRSASDATSTGEYEALASLGIATDDSIGQQGIRRRPNLTTPYVAPRSDLEEQIAQSWSEIMRLDRVGVYDNFFELGGDSLKATILLNRLRELVGKPVNAHALFQAQTINDLAAHLQNQFSDADGPWSPSTALGSTQDGIEGVWAAADAIPRLSRDAEAQRLLSRLDELTDEEVESLLQLSQTRSELIDE